MEPEYRPLACGVGIANWPSGRMALRKASAGGSIAVAGCPLGKVGLKVASSVASDRSSVRLGAIRTLDERLLTAEEPFVSRVPW